MAASQGKAAARSAEEAVRPQPQRFRVNVPAADEAVLAWMAAQYNHSLSVRLLIRESIERHGYVDAMNRPVEQLPKRGRPAVADDDAATEPSTGQAPHPSPAVLPQLPPAAAAAPVVPAAPATLDLDRIDDLGSGPELLGIALQTPGLVPVAAPQQSAPEFPLPSPPNPEQSPSEQVDVNDIFASTR